MSFRQDRLTWFGAPLSSAVAGKKPLDGRSSRPHRQDLLQGQRLMSGTTRPGPSRAAWSPWRFCPAGCLYLTELQNHAGEPAAAADAAADAATDQAGPDDADRRGDEGGPAHPAGAGSAARGESDGRVSLWRMAKLPRSAAGGAGAAGAAGRRAPAGRQARAAKVHRKESSPRAAQRAASMLDRRRADRYREMRLPQHRCARSSTG